MSLFGIPDPWIWMSYIGCFVCVAVTAIWMKIARYEEEEDE